jgi:DNA replication protein DnaC
MERDEAAEEKMGIGKMLAKYSNYKLLLLDEWLFNDYSDEELHFLFELIERRYDAASTLFCTQYKAEDWARQTRRWSTGRLHHGSNHS